MEVSVHNANDSNGNVQCGQRGILMGVSVHTVRCDIILEINGTFQRSAVRETETNLKMSL